MQVTIYKKGNLLRVRNVVGKLEKLLCSELTYQRRQYLATVEEQRRAGTSYVNMPVQCYEQVVIDGEPQIYAPAGFLQRIQAALQQNGYEPCVKELAVARDAKVYTPNWRGVSDFQWKHRQRETLELILAHERGQVGWATGAGKSWLMVPLCSVLPKARIAVCTKHISVLLEHYERLRQHLPSVGLVNGSRKEFGKRVTCISAGCLHHLSPDSTDILIADEHHELATDIMIEKFSRFLTSRMFGLSANCGDRADGADFELEGVFGPLITTLSYQEGVENDMIVPIEVHWRDVKMPRNPALGYESPVSRKRHGLWRNKYRNALIAEDARRFPDAQTLITVETLEHACYLKKHLPEFELCYASNDGYQDQIDQYIGQGLLPEGATAMTRDRLRELKKAFESGELRKVIATTVWNRGVNFHELQVLIRADASASSIADTQIPGRLSRVSSGKEAGILIDYLDQFDTGFQRKANKRKSDYRKKGWKQIFPDQELSGVFSNNGEAA